MTLLQTTVGYERFGLLSSPFSELDSESLTAVELCHVAQEVDRVLHGFKEQVVAKQTKASALLVGPLGVGKTERLRLAQAEAERLSLPHAFVQVKPDLDGVVRDLAAALLMTTRLGAVGRFLSPPGWHKDLTRLSKKGLGKAAPEEAARTIAHAVNANPPSFLLFNDLHALGEPAQVARFGEFVQTLLGAAEPGLLLLATCYPDFVPAAERHAPSLMTRFHRVSSIPSMTDADAAQLIAKRLATKRIVDDLDPTFPFDPESIREMNLRARHNPRELLKLAERVLDAGVQSRAYHIDVEATRVVLGAGPTAAETPDALAEAPRTAQVPVVAPSTPLVGAEGTDEAQGMAMPPEAELAAPPARTDSPAPLLTMAQRLRAARDGNA